VLHPDGGQVGVPVTSADPSAGRGASSSGGFNDRPTRPPRTSVAPSASSPRTGDREDAG